MTTCAFSNIKGGYLIYVYRKGHDDSITSFCQQDKLIKKLEQVEEDFKGVKYIYVPNPSGYLVTDALAEKNVQDLDINSQNILGAFTLDFMTGNKKVVLRDADLQNFLAEMFKVESSMILVKHVDAFESAIANLLDSYFDTTSETVMLAYKEPSEHNVFVIITVKDNKLHKYKKVSGYDFLNKVEDTELLKANIANELHGFKTDKVVFIGENTVLKVLTDIDPHKKPSAMRMLGLDDILGGDITQSDDYTSVILCSLMGAAMYYA